MHGTTDTLTVGERIAWYRRRRGMSQAVLADLVGRTVDWLSKIENNRIDLDRLSVIKDLANALHVSLGDLLVEPSLMDFAPTGERQGVRALRDGLVNYRLITPFDAVAAHELPKLAVLERHLSEVWAAYGGSVRWGRAVEGPESTGTGIPTCRNSADEARRDRPRVDRRRPRTRCRARNRRHHCHRFAVPICHPRPPVRRTVPGSGSAH